MGLALATVGCRDGGTEPFRSTSSQREVAIVIIRPASVVSLPVTRGTTLTAELRDAENLLVNGSILWTSSDPSVARLVPLSTNSKGVYITAMRAGSATITATSGSKSASVVITAHDPGPVATVSVQGPNSMAMGTTARIIAQPRDLDAIKLPNTVTFASSNPAVVSVSSTGELIARAEGTASVSATSDGKVGLLSLVVTAPMRAFVWTAATGMEDLGVLPGFVMSRATAVSATGHIVGTMSTLAESLSHAFLRPPGAGATMLDLGGLTASGSSGAFGVNSSGRVVGYAITPNGDRHAVSWSATGAIQDLGVLPGHVESEARAINDAGQVVGWSRDRSGPPRSFIWTEATGMRQIPGSDFGMALAINQAGVIGGQAAYRPYVWSPVTGFHSLGVMVRDHAGRVVAINGTGETVGTSLGCADADYYYDCDPIDYECLEALAVDCPPQYAHPVWWLELRQAVDLRKASAAGPLFATTSGINASRQVVGRNTSGRALLWSGSGALRDLGVLPGRQQSAATAINDAGVVVGWSWNP